MDPGGCLRGGKEVESPYISDLKPMSQALQSSLEPAPMGPANYKIWVLNFYSGPTMQGSSSHVGD